MRHWQAAILGIGCFLLASWYSTSIVLSDDGQVLILNAALRAGKKRPTRRCAVGTSRLEKLEQGKVRQLNTR